MAAPVLTAVNDCSVRGERNHAYANPADPRHTHLGDVPLALVRALYTTIVSHYTGAAGITLGGLRLLTTLDGALGTFAFANCALSFVGNPFLHCRRVEAYDTGSGPERNNHIGYDDAVYRANGDGQWTLGWRAGYFENDNMAWSALVPSQRQRAHVFMYRHNTFYWTDGAANVPPVRCSVGNGKVRNSDTGPGMNAILSPFFITKACMRGYRGDEDDAPRGDSGERGDEVPRAAVDDSEEDDEDDVPPLAIGCGDAETDEPDVGAAIVVLLSQDNATQCSGTELTAEAVDVAQEGSILAAVAASPSLLIVLCVRFNVHIATLAGRFSPTHFIRLCLKAAAVEGVAIADEMAALHAVDAAWKCLPSKSGTILQLALGCVEGNSNGECVFANALVAAFRTYGTASGLGDLFDMFSNGQLRFRFAASVPGDVIAMRRAMAGSVYSPHSLCIERKFDPLLVPWSPAVVAARRTRGACRMCGNRSTRWLWSTSTVDVRLCRTCVHPDE